MSVFPLIPSVNSTKEPEDGEAGREASPTPDTGTTTTQTGKNQIKAPCCAISRNNVCSTEPNFATRPNCYSNVNISVTHVVLLAVFTFVVVV